MDICNCTYTTTSGKQANVSISVLMKLISEIPETPKLFTMPIEMVRSPLLPENYIILSNGVAEALEQALKG